MSRYTLQSQDACQSAGVNDILQFDLIVPEPQVVTSNAVNSFVIRGFKVRTHHGRSRFHYAMTTHIRYFEPARSSPVARVLHVAVAVSRGERGAAGIILLHVRHSSRALRDRLLLSRRGV